MQKSKNNVGGIRDLDLILDEHVNEFQGKLI